jgi:long-chain fatty acid transport protein
MDGTANSDSQNFLIPEFGYNRLINPYLSLGVTVYGNGGMNTNYPGGQIPAGSACAGFNPTPGPYNLLCSNGRLGIHTPGPQGRRRTTLNRYGH